MAPIREIVETLVNSEPRRNTANRFFTEARLRWYAVAIAAGCAAITFLLWPSLHSGRPGQHCLDFNWIWVTGKRAASHAAAQVFDPTATLPPDIAALDQFQCAGTPADGAFSYPPTILFFTYPLGLMSYSTALAAWNAATLLLYLAAIYAILRRAAAVCAALTIYPVALNILIGHNGCLTAGLLGLALAFMERRPWLSGAFLGLLTYKPHFGVLFPLALLAARKWRVFLAATVATIAFAAAAAIVFGYDLWPSFMTGIIAARSRVNHSHTVSNVIFPTVLGVLRHLDIGIQTAWAAQAGVAVAAAAAVGVLWSRPISYPLKAAAIAFASLVASPYALTYDYCITAVGVAFLVKHDLERGFMPGERALLLVCWGGFSLFAFLGAILVAGARSDAGFGGTLLYFLLGVTPILVCVALFGQIVRRALSELSQTPRPAVAGEPVAGKISG